MDEAEEGRNLCACYEYLLLLSRFRCSIFFNENSEIVFLKIKLVCLFCFFLKTSDFKCNLLYSFIIAFYILLGKLMEYLC